MAVSSAKLAVFILARGIDESKSTLGQHVEEHLFGIHIVKHRAVIVEVVACEIGENSTREIESIDAMLTTRVRTHLHESVLASGVDHIGQHLVERKRVGCGLCGRNDSVVDDVAHGR